MRTYIQPWLARVISSSLLLDFKRRVHELKRIILRRPHLVSVFIRADDPYSYLLLQVLPELAQRYKVSFRYYVVSHRMVLNRQDNMYPEPSLWHQNALRDSAHIAKLYQLDLPLLNQLPSPELTKPVTNQLLALEPNDDFLEGALTVLKGYWNGDEVEFVKHKELELKELELKDSEHKDSEHKDLDATLSDNEELLESLGHYLSATLHYAGEWYWGIDRLAHLERRLNTLKLSNSAEVVKFAENTKHFCQRLPKPEQYQKRPSTPLIIYFSARSPYSYLGLLRGVALARHYTVPIEVKPVLPMMMRGMFVPPRKKWYIFADTKREAITLGLDYGFVADPLGVGVERCYALFNYAKSQHKEVEYLLAFAKAVNARAIHSDTDRGMKKIVEQAGLEWSQAKPLLQKDETLNSDDWRQWAEANYAEMHSLGLWGVPCFRYADTTVWGQDRLDVIERAICDAIVSVNT
ncbi:MAG: 2-hydroxychromene-2-carboxylate isomerase [Arenicella sp.]|jgi:2-hydroxychromene-2-carboxylate isomerase